MVRRIVVPQKRMNNRRGKRLLKRLAAFFVLGCLLFTLFYILSMGYNYIALKRPRTAYLALGTLDKRLKLQGLVIRDESVLVAPASGRISLTEDPNQRVAVGMPVAQVTDVEVEKEVNTRLLEIDRLLEEENEVNQEDIDRAKRTIQENGTRLVAAVRHLTSTLSLGGFGSDLLEGISQVLDERRVLFKEMAEMLRGRNDLLQEKEAELERLRSATHTIEADRAGILSFTTDGLEGSLTPLNMRDLTPSDISQVSAKESHIEDGSIVYEGQPVGKIINNFEWYIVVSAELAEAEELARYRNVKVRIGEHQDKVQAEFYDFGGQDDERQVVILKVTQDVSDLPRLRKVDVEVTLWSEDGYIVPASSIVDADGKTGIYVIRHGKREFVAVDSVKFSESQAVIAASGLKAGMKIVLKP